jgi:hypothetical protein
MLVALSDTAGSAGYAISSSRRGSIPDRNAGRTEAARAYRLLHIGMAQAVADGLTPAHPCLVKGASQWDSKDRMQRRTPTAQEV